MSYAPVQRLYRFQIGELCGLKSTKQVTIVKGTTVPASVTAHKDQSQDKAFEESVPSMTVHFEATTPGGTGERGTKASTSDKQPEGTDQKPRAPHISLASKVSQAR